MYLKLNNIYIIQMNELIFDIKLYIANLNDDAWYKLYLVDDDIRKYIRLKKVRMLTFA